MSSIEAVIFDYGGVLSTRQVEEEKAKMEELAGANPEDFWQAYWRHRPEYDCGLPGNFTGRRFYHLAAFLWPGP